MSVCKSALLWSCNTYIEKTYWKCSYEGTKWLFFVQVKTVQMGKYEDYDKTNRFYLSLGFKELGVFPTLWDDANPCPIYVMAL